MNTADKVDKKRGEEAVLEKEVFFCFLVFLFSFLVYSTVKKGRRKCCPS